MKPGNSPVFFFEAKKSTGSEKAIGNVWAIYQQHIDIFNLSFLLSILANTFDPALRA
jgi:hypothetical protein